jgi:hypothetical protein
MPGIFSDATNRRRHFYFGEGCRERVRRLFSFWQAARQGDVTRAGLVIGSADESSIQALPAEGDPCEFDRLRVVKRVPLT